MSSCLYLEHNTFQTENHGKIIPNLKDKNIRGQTPYPAPKPTISTRGDWRVKYYGLHVLVGEAKSCHGTKEDTDEGINFGIFVASNQLAFSPRALLMHSTNSHFRFYHLQQNEVENRIDVECREGYPYSLEFVSQATDPRQPVPQEYADLPGIYCRRTPTDTFTPKYSTQAKTAWRGLRLPLIKFLIATFQAVDILVKQFTEMNFDTAL